MFHLGRIRALFDFPESLPVIGDQVSQLTDTVRDKGISQGLARQNIENCRSPVTEREGITDKPFRNPGLDTLDNDNLFCLILINRQKVRLIIEIKLLIPGVPMVNQS